MEASERQQMGRYIATAQFDESVGGDPHLHRLGANDVDGRRLAAGLRSQSDIDRERSHVEAIFAPPVRTGEAEDEDEGGAAEAPATAGHVPMQPTARAMQGGWRQRAKERVERGGLPGP
eukprot:GHVU01207475.1.p2 GENE.GHVU01207475.1~~GHVU01207475.1.p2  ORF type:complete len:119 (+),score=27.87 GHVU01207475.1:335-691(+)